MESTERRASDAGASLSVLATLSATIELALAEDDVRVSRALDRRPACTRLVIVHSRRLGSLN
jgi:hypothetical protein